MHDSPTPVPPSSDPPVGTRFLVPSSSGWLVLTLRHVAGDILTFHGRTELDESAIGPLARGTVDEYVVLRHHLPGLVRLDP